MGDTINKISSLFIAIGLIYIVLSCGCVGEPKKPTITVDSIEFKNINNQETNLNVRVIVDNPNPIGAQVNKISFKIFYINENGKLKYLGEGEKNNIDITSGKNVVDIPVSLSNKELIKALGENVGKGNLKLEIDGYATVDLKVSNINIPFKREKTVKLPDGINSKLEKLKSLGVGFDIRDFKEPTATVDGIEFDNDIIIEPSASISPNPSDNYAKIEATTENDVHLKECYLTVRVKVDNPNPISIDVKNIEFDIYGDDDEYLGHGVKYNQHIGKSGNTSISIRVKVKNKEALENIVKLTKNDKITIKVSGTATIKEIKEIGLSEMEIPINRQKVVELPTKLKELKERFKSGDKQEPSQPLYISISPNNPKVENSIRIEVTDGNNNPVEGAKITIDRVIKKTTDSNGIVLYTFKIGGEHTIKAEKDGYYPRETSISVEKRFEPPISPPTNEPTPLQQLNLPSPNTYIYTHILRMI